MTDPSGGPISDVAANGHLRPVERLEDLHGSPGSESSTPTEMTALAADPGALMDQIGQPSIAERLVEISPKQLDFYNRKCEVIRPLLKDDPTFDPAATVRSQARKYGFTRAALYGWLKQLEKAGGLHGMIPTPRGGKGRSRSIDEANEQDLVEYAVWTAQVLMENTGVDQVPTEEILRRIRKLAADKGWTIPSRYVLRRLVGAKLPRMLRKRAVGGAEGFRKDVLPKLPASGPDGPNRVWVGDCKRLHVWCIGRDGRSHRFTIIVILDRFDGCVMGWAFDRHPNAFAFGRALCMAILTYGIPDSIVTDKGPEFINRYTETILHALRIRLQQVTPGHPWVRGDMEAFFRTLDVMLCRFKEGHSGNKPTSKPLSRDAKYTIEEFHKEFQSWLRETYHVAAFHPRRLNGVKITREALRGSVPYVARMPDERDLPLRLLPVQIRQMDSQGVSLHQVLYCSDDPQFKLLIMERAKVEVRFDPLDLAGVWVFFKHRFVCYAINAAAYRAGLTLEDIRERQRGNRSIEKAVRLLADPQMRKYRDMNEHLTRLTIEREPSQVAAVAGGPAQSVAFMLPVERSVRRAIAAESESTARGRRTRENGLRRPFDKHVELEEWEK